MMLRSSLVALAVAASLAAVLGTARADNLNPPPYVGEPCSTHGVGVFVGGVLNEAASSFSSVPCGPYALFLPEPEIIAVAPGFFLVRWPNFVDPFSMKDMRIQVTFDDPQGTGPRPIEIEVTAIDNGQSAQVQDHTPGPKIPQPCFLCQPPGDLYWFGDWWIVPNPDFEEIALRYEPTWQITQVVIDTISVPEPVGIALMGLGVAGFGVIARRRRRAT